MHLLILIALFVSCGVNAEATRMYRTVPFAMGGSQVIFKMNGTKIEDDVLLKCVVRFSDGRDSIEVKPTLPQNGQSVICRLPPEINSGSVVVDVEATSRTKSTKTVLLSEDVFINESPSGDVIVDEKWATNQLTITWDAEYFRQFFNPGAVIVVQLFVYAADTFQPVFKATAFSQVLGMNTGTSTIAVTSANIDRISNTQFPYFYVLRPVASPTVFMSSLLFAPTIAMTNAKAADTCVNWLQIAEVPDEIHPCPPCLCQVQLDDNFFQSQYDPELLKFANGALDNQVLYYERVPTKGGHAQACSYDTLTGNLDTTSRVQASWIHDVSQYLSYQNNFIGDIWPYVVCCLQSNVEQLCALFHEKRPIDTGHQYEGPENPTCGWGDPHFVTYNNVKYDFQGNGEFWLIRNQSQNGFGVQGRMSPTGKWTKVSLFNAVAIKDGNTRIQMEIENTNRFHLSINGVEFPIPADQTTLLLENAHVITNRNTVNVRLQTGFTVVADYIAENANDVYLNVYGSGAHRHKGKGFMGLFGNLNYNAQNDLTSQNGLVIAPTKSNLTDLPLLHNLFGLTWMTTASESLFGYDDGKSWEDYAKPGFGPILEYPDPASMPDEVQAICGDSLFCYYEYVGTESLEKAQDVVRIEDGLEDRREEIKTVDRPMCDVVRSPANGRVQVTGHFDGSIATYSCNREYDFESGDMTRACFASANESFWTGVEPVCIWTCTTCKEDTEFELTHHPADCTKFFLCSMGQRLSLDCPIGTAFNPAMLQCEEGFVCRDPPGC